MRKIDKIDTLRAMQQQSPDPSTKVGAVVCGPRGELRGAAWNDFPPGIPESWWHDRELKYKAVVHAEVAAIIRAGAAAEGGTIMITHHPCRECAKVIITAGITRVECPPGPWRDAPEVVATCQEADVLFERCGVEVVTL